MLKKSRRIALWLLLSTLMAGLLWAGVELLGESNKVTADAGSNAADLEMASLDAVKPDAKVKAKGVSREVALKRKITQIDNAYIARLNAAKSEIASGGEVREATRSAGLKLARDYKEANDELSAWYDGHGSASRAEVCRAVGESRVASAEMAFNKIDGDKIDASNAKQDALNKALKTYLADARNDLTDAERASIKASMTPRLQQLSSNVQTLISQVTSLLNQVSSSASPAAMAGCAAKTVATSSDPSDVAGSLLMPLKSLLSLVKGMAGNISGMMSDVNSL
ncbi:MAG: hypothetical protein LBQ10_00855 [Desulfovibrio sp.]|jgi:hypothetical protein|nr:hypothetical protein [Desulfovibrio sp.]